MESKRGTRAKLRRAATKVAERLGGAVFAALIDEASSGKGEGGKREKGNQRVKNKR